MQLKKKLKLKTLSETDYFNDRKQAYFVDLFVRVSNTVAINMYKNLGNTFSFPSKKCIITLFFFFFKGYIIYRTVLEYYSTHSGSPDEDAYGKHKSILVKPFLKLFFFCLSFVEKT